MTASITMSQSARSCGLVVPFRRARIASGDSLIVPFSANLARDFSIPEKPLSRNLCSTSRTVTLKPAVELTCAMPEPINPQPRTPTFLISMTTSPTCICHPERSEGSAVREQQRKCRFLARPRRRLRTARNDKTEKLPRCILVQIFHDHCDSLPASDAGGPQAILLFPASEFVKQRDDQPRAGRTQWMSQRNRAAIHVDFFTIESQLLFDGQVL